jgi:hypothetical protein
MKYILKNAETEHINDMYGYYGAYSHGDFVEVTPNGDGTYTDLMHNRKFFGDGLYMEEREGGEFIGYRLLHETGNEAMFPIGEWRSGDQGWKQYPKMVSGTTVVECTLDGEETSTMYYMHVNTEYDYITLYYMNVGAEGFCENKSEAEHLKMIQPIQEKDYITSVVPGVTYNGQKVAYNGRNVETVVRCFSVGGDPIITSYTISTDFCYFKPADIAAWDAIASERMQWNAKGIKCFDKDYNEIRPQGSHGHFNNGFFMPEGTRYVEFSYFVVEYS